MRIFILFFKSFQHPLAEPKSCYIFVPLFLAEMLEPTKKLISSTKHTGFEDVLSTYFYFSLPALADFFFAYLGPLSPSKVNCKSAKGLALCQPFFILKPQKFEPTNGSMGNHSRSWCFGKGQNTQKTLWSPCYSFHYHLIIMVIVRILGLNLLVEAI
jgi:hypothetical protein